MTAIRTIGITGSRRGLTEDQREELWSRLHALYSIGARTLHHGDCVGVDEETSAIAEVLGYQLVSHPPENEKLRAYVESQSIWTPKGYLERDQDIVDCSDFLIGCPDGPPRKGSGTWYTLNYADQTGTRYLVIRPDGTAWVVNRNGEWEWSV